MEEKKSFFKRYPSFCIFAVLAVLIILMAILAPQLSGGVSPTKGSLAEAIQAPSADHPFGTDKMGRDIFVRVLYGARTSLSSTFILVAVIFVIGTILGILAALILMVILFALDLVLFLSAKSRKKDDESEDKQAGTTTA